MSKKLPLSDLPSWPRLMSLPQAAAYCGMSEPHFKNHLNVTPKRFGERKLYDKTEIDNILNGSIGVSDWTELLNDNQA